MDETIDGVPVSDGQIKVWQEQAREALEVEGLHGRGRPRLGKPGESPVIPVRMDEDLLRALTERAEQDDDSPVPELRLGFDPHGRLLERVVLVFDSGNEMLIHAMRARKQYWDLLP